MRNENGLTLQQQKFADHYLISGNATDAYNKAGYAAKKGESRWNAASTALGLIGVQSYIEKRQKELQALLRVDQERVLTGFAEVAFGSIKDVATWGPDGVTLKDAELLAGQHHRLVKKVKPGKYGPEIEMKDSLQALTKLGEHLGILEGPGKNVFAPVQINITIETYGEEGLVETEAVPVDGVTVGKNGNGKSSELKGKMPNSHGRDKDE